MRRPRILNRAAQAKEPQGLEEGASPRRGPAGGQTGSRALEKQPTESAFDVLVDGREVVRRIARAEVLSPAAEHRIEVRHHEAEVRVAPGAGRQVSHAGAHPRHRTLRGPPLEIVDTLPCPLPDGPAHALAQVTSEEVKPVAAAREVDRPRLLRMQFEPEPSQHEAHSLTGFLDLRLRVAHDHKVIGVADQRAKMRHRSSHTRSRTCR